MALGLDLLAIPLLSFPAANGFLIVVFFVMLCLEEGVEALDRGAQYVWSVSCVPISSSEAGPDALYIQQTVRQSGTVATHYLSSSSD